MSGDKLFDGSDAHLLPGNAELIARLREYHNTDLEYGGFGVKEAVDAANALEAAGKRIAELEAEHEKSELAWRELDDERVAFINQIGDILMQGECESLENAASRVVEDLYALAEKQIRTEEELRQAHHYLMVRETAKDEEAERKLAVAREAIYMLKRHVPVESALHDQAEEALAQIGGDDAG